LLGRIVVEEVWGIGPSHARVLKQHGITTALQLRQADDQWIRKHMGIVSLRLVHELRGQSCLPLDQCPQPKQGITCSRAFGKPITTLAEMEEAVSFYASRAAEKLRHESLAATVVTVFLMTNEFKDGPQYRNALTITLPVATDTTHELIRVSLNGIRKLYRDGYEYKKAGVMLTGLVSLNQVQTDLFDCQDRARSKRLMSVLDAINDRWGDGTLRYAASGINRTWRTQFHRRSPAYTTHWSDLPLAQAK
jgi:DNA polymerase V